MTTNPSAAKADRKFPSFDELPDSAWVRQAQLIRDPKRPNAPVVLPFSSATFWRKIKAGTFPQPTKLGGGRISAWSVQAVRKWLAAHQV